MQPDINDPQFKELAAAILQRHERGEAEANITSAVRDFLIATDLAKSEEIVEENPPSDGSRRAVDLTALDTFMEMKRRVSNLKPGFDPDPEYVRQLDEYLELSVDEGKGIRTGVLTDGKYWLLRWPGAGAVNTSPPYGFVLGDADSWLPLYEWLRDAALVSLDDIQPTRENIEKHLGPDSPAYRRDIDSLRRLYASSSDYETVKVKRGLWHDLLRAALGEIASDDIQLDDLYVRHTYLTAVVGMAVQAAFGIDVRTLAATDPEDLVYGRQFRNATGLQGVVESDFFAWPAEVGGLPLLIAISRRVARFDWRAGSIPNDIAAILYETVIPPDERRTLGEYYTPQWLAKTITQELVTDPLNQRVLDPACGSGTFVAEAITNFIDAARNEGVSPAEVFGKLRMFVSGIDVHPVAVHLARAAYVIAARTAIRDAEYTSVTVPIYLGDALQLRFRSGDMFAEREIAIQVNDEENSELLFPVRLVERPDTFDALVADIADYIQSGDDPMLALHDHRIDDVNERKLLTMTITTLQRLHDEGRDHIWAYYTRNMVRPVALSRSKVDVIIGNPPWLSYRNTISVLRTALELQSKRVYNIWAGREYVNRQDVAGLFFARSVDLYLETGGIIGMVMPHSALQAGQYSKWRAGFWRASDEARSISVDFGFKNPWDLERLRPSFFPSEASSVVFAKNKGADETAVPLRGLVERWVGETGTDSVQRLITPLIDSSIDSISPYKEYTRRGTQLTPRCLFFASEIANPSLVHTGQTVTLTPRRGVYDKEPWKTLDLATLTEQTIEASHMFDIHLGETVVPYASLEPLRAALPLRQGEYQLSADDNGPGGIKLSGLERLMRRRWQVISGLWEEHKGTNNRLSLLGRIDYQRELSVQLQWQQDPVTRPIRVVYTRSGEPTATIIDDDRAIIECKLFWITCRSLEEAYYLLAIINSDYLADAVNVYTVPNWSGRTRDLQTHLWKLPIPEFDPDDELQVEVSQAGEVAAACAQQRLTLLRSERGADITWRIVRRELRAWLRSSEEGKRVEDAVGALLARNPQTRREF